MDSHGVVVNYLHQKMKYDDDAAAADYDSGGDDDDERHDDDVNMAGSSVLCAFLNCQI